MTLKGKSQRFGRPAWQRDSRLLTSALSDHAADLERFRPGCFHLEPAHETHRASGYNCFRARVARSRITSGAASPTTM
jgi:hypothetical protein